MFQCPIKLLEPTHTEALKPEAEHETWKRIDKR